jgi:hypothetical protein
MNENAAGAGSCYSTAPAPAETEILLTNKTSYAKVQKFPKAASGMLQER